MMVEKNCVIGNEFDGAGCGVEAGYVDESCVFLVGKGSERLVEWSGPSF